MTRPLDDAFARGDYHHVAWQAGPEDWHRHAALGLCGNIAPALGPLSASDSAEQRFYEGVVRWIDGDETGAARLLARCDSEHADNLLRLIRKPRISVLTQLPWQRSFRGPHTLLHAGENDPKFRLRNISFAGEDLPNAPDADIHSFYDPADPPDFYLAEMIEWHLIPPNLREIPCPTVGQTGDYDLHIQTVYPWLRIFDELVVTDSTEYADVARLVDAPVTTFCKPVSLPLHLLPEIEVERDLDLVLTGSSLHSYFPDKAEMMRQMLAADNFSPYFLSGFLVYYLYYPILARSKLSVALTRHLGAIPSRGYEALAMGTVLLAPRESCMRLFADENEGVVPFSLADDGLKTAIERTLGDYPRHAEAAQRGMRIVREQFNPWRVASQYLRMATFLAARPRPPREPMAHPMQKRSVAYKGWMQHDERRTHMAIRNASLTRWKETLPEDHTLDSFCNPARELLLEYVHGDLMPGEESHEAPVRTALNIYRSALPQFPDSLALRFNYVRTALHFGTEQDVENALAVVRETLDRDPAGLILDPRDDVMTWDYCQNFFNYRDYLQVATEALCQDSDRSADLKRLVLASLHYYDSRITGNDAGFERAAALDPGFTVYRLWHAKGLARRGAPEQAVALLSGVVREILYAPEAWSLIRAISDEHGVAVPDEAALRRLVERMETRTLIDEAYAGIRVGPYFRKQRLDLARNPGLAPHKRSAREAPRLSVLIADTNGCRHGVLLESLARQTMDRNAFEILYCDVFDRVAPQAMQHADSVMVIGQDEHLYNRNAAFDFALAEARGDIVVFCDGEAPLPETALAAIASEAEVLTTNRLVLINAGGTDRQTIHTVALARRAAIDTGGLDESAYYAGAFSGPYELVERLRGQRWTVRPLDALPAGPSGATTETGQHDISALFRDIWPSKFSPWRGMPLRENAEIMRLRRQAP